jgi:hypothetical protein
LNPGFQGLVRAAKGRERGSNPNNPINSLTQFGWLLPCALGIWKFDRTWRLSFPWMKDKLPRPQTFDFAVNIE